METIRRHVRVLVVAALAGSAVGALGITQAHALGAQPAGAVSVHWVLGGRSGFAIAAAELTLERPARTVAIRPGGAGWVRCSVHGLRATCPLGARTLDLGRLDRVDVVATS